MEKIKRSDPIIDLINKHKKFFSTLDEDNNLSDYEIYCRLANFTDIFRDFLQVKLDYQDEYDRAVEFFKLWKAEKYIIAKDELNRSKPTKGYKFSNTEYEYKYMFDNKKEYKKLMDDIHIKKYRLEWIKGEYENLLSYQKRLETISFGMSKDKKTLRYQ